MRLEVAVPLDVKCLNKKQDRHLEIVPHNNGDHNEDTFSEKIYWQVVDALLISSHMDVLGNHREFFYELWVLINKFLFVFAYKCQNEAGK